MMGKVCLSAWLLFCFFVFGWVYKKGFLGKFVFYIISGFSAALYPYFYEDINKKDVWLAYIIIGVILSITNRFIYSLYFASTAETTEEIGRNEAESDEVAKKY